jgi:hypothetical protein
MKRLFCARDWIRTSTPFRAPPPQSGASTNFATRALVKELKKGLQMYEFTSSVQSGKWSLFPALNV